MFTVLTSTTNKHKRAISITAISITKSFLSSNTCYLVVINATIINIKLGDRACLENLRDRHLQTL
jgi:hypothetical protein